VDLAHETELDDELRGWMAFAVQKLDEIVVLAEALEDNAAPRVQQALQHSRAAVEARSRSTRLRREEVRTRCAEVGADMLRRDAAYAERARLQRQQMELTLFPTTTIGSFPQTGDIRAVRRRYRNGELDEAGYHEQMQAEIAKVIRVQEELGLDVLVHGEAERNDMVEYFGEQLAGFAFSANGWVQSYGSRCVKPPIIYGDVYRPQAMTVAWTRYAQGLTDKPVKGMLTGPVTIMAWSFLRNDLPRETVCRQIALALRDEVADLEQAGTRVIQIDEPAFREVMPLRRGEWPEYFRWAVECFRLTSCGVDNGTQIHTHMCYSEFNDIIEAIAEMDADVITIETARSEMELLKVFGEFEYPNEIGPGLYDIHSPLVPEREQLLQLLHKAAACIPPQRLWVNPDCGLKTRDWPETRAALHNLVAAATELRKQHAA